MVTEQIRALVEPPDSPPPLPAARRAALRLTRRHYENFTLISLLVPRRMRPHIAAVYAFCRTVDDIGDEAPGDRLSLLDRFESELRSAYSGTPRHPVIVALRDTIRRFDLPPEPFLKLIEANRIDQRKHRYADFEELLHYCDHSANPVGRLFLMLYGYRDEELFGLADRTCTALQLVNFWQDLKRDYESGRIYLPEDEMEHFGVREEDLGRETASGPLRGLLRFQVERARDYFRGGLALLDRVSGRLRIDIGLFSRGGLAILSKIEEGGYDTLSRRPTLSKPEKMRLFLSALISRRYERWIGS